MSLFPGVRDWASFTFIPGISMICRAQGKSTNGDASLHPSLPCPGSILQVTGLCALVSATVHSQGRGCPGSESRFRAVWTGTSSIHGTWGMASREVRAPGGTSLWGHRFLVRSESSKMYVLWVVLWERIQSNYQSDIR